MYRCNALGRSRNGQDSPMGSKGSPLMTTKLPFSKGSSSQTPDLGIKWIALTPDGSLKIYHDLVEPLSEESFNDLRFCNQNVVNLLQHHLLSEQVDWAILIDREAVSGLSELSL